MSHFSSESKRKRTPAEPAPSCVDSKDTSEDQSSEALTSGTQDPLSIGQESNMANVGASAVVGGAAAGALGGAVAGPVGVAVGSVLGAVAVGLGARTLSEAIDPSFEVDFWTDECTRRDYYDPKVGPEPYLIAYRIGFEGHDPKVSFEEREPELKARWEASEAAAKIAWTQARCAMRDAWQRVASQYHPNDMQSQ